MNHSATAETCHIHSAPEAIVLDLADLPRNKNTFKFEGYLHGDANVSFFLVEAAQGGGSELHSHPYEEVHVVLEGQGTYTVGDKIVVAKVGTVIVVPAGTAHKFRNDSTVPLKLIGIHAAKKMIQMSHETSSAT